MSDTLFTDIAILIRNLRFFIRNMPSELHFTTTITMYASQQEKVQTILAFNLNIAEFHFIHYNQNRELRSSSLNSFNLFGFMAETLKLLTNHMANRQIHR